jgi:hypothetical protein
MVRPVAPLILVAVMFAAAGCARPTVSTADAGRTSAAPAASATGASPSASPSAAPPSPSPTPSYPPYEKAHVAPFDLGHLRNGPANPVVGTAYPFDLYIHCGGLLVRFGGASWRAAQPLDRLATGGGYISGTMELLDADTTRYVNDQRYYDSPVEVIIYRKTDEEVPRCM